MDFAPTQEQTDIINAGLFPQCVIACPGSGKTATAVRRLLEVRSRLADDRGHIALFSYSNIAVETFRSEYKKLCESLPLWSSRVLIETVDAFLTTYIVRPHGALVMGASRTPFLVHGNENFLRRVTIYDGARSHTVDELRIRLKEDGSLEYFLQVNDRKVPAVSWSAEAAMRAMGKMGAYTYELARYWAVVALKRNNRLLRAVCQRFPHLMVDEAQDIGLLHGTLISVLASGGTQVSLIGDPNQGIYDFNGADGSFLREYSVTAGVTGFPLSQNRRSVLPIITLANVLAGSESKVFREPAARTHGAYYLRYNERDLDAIMTSFSTLLEFHGYARTEGAILCRGNGMVDRLTGGGDSFGQGATERFARAAVLRDRSGDIAACFEQAATGLVRILKQDEPTLLRNLLSSSAEADHKTLRRILWAFLRDAHSGLPSAKLLAATEWQPLLKQRLPRLFTEIEENTSFTRSNTWAANVKVTKLAEAPLWDADFATNQLGGIRVDTVHQAKGESIPAVFYLARTADVNKMLDGTNTEHGRVGYVAVTRAMDLLLVGVPDTAKLPVINRLEAKGFVPWPG